MLSLFLCWVVNVLLLATVARAEQEQATETKGDVPCARATSVTLPGYLHVIANAAGNEGHGCHSQLWMGWSKGCTSSTFEDAEQIFASMFPG